jgi:hypothetical protein
MKTVALIILLIAVTLLVTGCAVPQGAAPTQPRAIQWGAGNPFCLILCFATAQATDAEKGTATGGTSTQTGTLSVGASQ